MSSNSINQVKIKKLDGTYDARDLSVNYDNVDGLSDIVPVPTIYDSDKFLKGDGTWGKVSKGVSYGTSSTAADVASKVVTSAGGDFELEEGASINVKFTYGNTAETPTLNIDTLGNKLIKAYGTEVPSLWWNAGDIVNFVYDGTNFIMKPTESQINTHTSEISSLSTAESELASEYTIINSEVSTLDSNLTANNIPFKFGYDSTTQKYGYVINEGGTDTVHPFKTVQASKTVTAGTSATTVTPDSGYDGVASVTVNPTPSQSKSASPSTSAQTISPDSGKLLSSVPISAISPQYTDSRRAATDGGNDGTPYIRMPYGWYPEYAATPGKSYVYLTPAQAVAACPSQSKSASPSTSAQTITPDSGKLLSSVSVSAISPNLSEDTRYQHEVNNSTPTLIGDAGFFTTVYDRVSKTNLGNYFEIRFNGSKNKSNVNMTAGWMNSNTLLALPSQTKTITASRSQQTVTPDSNKVLQSVTVNKYPDASGTYGTITTNGTHDMGASNNYRYVSVSVSGSLGHVRYLDSGSLTSAGGAWWDQTATMGAKGRCIITVIDNSSNTVQIYKNGNLIAQPGASSYVPQQTSVPGYYFDVNNGDKVRIRIFYGFARVTCDLFYAS